MSLKGKITLKNGFTFKAEAIFHTYCVFIHFWDLLTLFWCCFCTKTVFLRPGRQWGAPFVAPGSLLCVKAATPAPSTFPLGSGCRAEAWCVTYTIELTLYCWGHGGEKTSNIPGKATTVLGFWESLWARTCLRTWSEWLLLPNQTHLWPWVPGPGNIQALDF